MHNISFMPLLLNYGVEESVCIYSSFDVGCSQWPSTSIVTDEPTALITGYHSLHISTSPTINVHKNW